MATKLGILINCFLKIKYNYLYRVAPDEMILHFLGHIKDDDLLTDDNFDDDHDGLDDNLELPSMTKYSASCDFVKAVRGMHYNSQAKVFRAFHKFIMKGDIWENMFLECFEESCDNINFDGDKVDFYTLE